MMTPVIPQLRYPTAILLVLLAGCTSNPRIQSDYSVDLNLESYETYSIFGQVDVETLDRAHLLEYYFTKAVMQELVEKGLTKSKDPEIVINVFVVLEDLSRAPNRQNDCPSYEDYYSREKDRSLGGFHGASRRPMCKYTEVLVTVELVDGKRDETIMTGNSRIRIDENDWGGKYLMSSVMYDVATMFGERPARSTRRVSVIHPD